MIIVVPIGDVKEAQLEVLKLPLEGIFGQEVQIGSSIAIPDRSFYPERNQYLASSILSVLYLPKSESRLIGVADVDLFAPGLNFVFGQADVSGKRALISLHRLRQELYGLPENENLCNNRALKEAVHELGHTYGLGHCPNSKCVMHFSNSLADTDLKGWNFCSACQRKLNNLR
jgi:archaemetzincin